ncbi:hypothetical protein MCEMSEM23_01101 [Rhabdaerophilaceae bacterium]
MGKTFAHPQPHWLPLHELPFQFPEPKSAKEAATDEEAFLLLSEASKYEALKEKCSKLSYKYKINKGIRFAKIAIEKKCFVFGYNDPIYDINFSETEIICIDIGLLADKHHFSSGYLFGLGVDIYPYVKAVWETAIDHFLEEMPAGLRLWARPSNPRAGFSEIETGSIRFYRTSELLRGILLCEGADTLFDARIEREGEPATELASVAAAIEFAADALSSNPNMTKGELKDALGRRFLAISDRRLQRIWAKARLQAGLPEFAKAGRKPGKSNR